MPFTAEQLQERRKHLGGSEAASALGMSPWFSEVQLWESKVIGAPPIEETIPMMVGTALEPTVIRILEKDRDIMVVDRQRPFTDESTPWRRCTVDGVWMDGREPVIIEAKTSGGFAGWGEDEDAIPIQYLYNIHHSFLCVPEAKRAIFPVLLGGRAFRVYEVKRDPDLCFAVNQVENLFWKVNVQGKIPPIPTSMEDLKILHPKSQTLKTVTINGGIENEVTALVREQALLKATEERVETIKTRIGNFMGDAEAMIDGAGRVMVTWKSQTRGAHQVKESSFRVMRVK